MSIIVHFFHRHSSVLLVTRCGEKWSWLTLLNPRAPVQYMVKHGTIANYRISISSHARFVRI